MKLLDLLGRGIKVLVKAFYWSLLVAVFGLLQFWINWAIAALFDTQHSAFYDVAKDCALLFFLTAAIVSVAIDFHLNDNVNATRSQLARFAFTFFPMLVVGFAVFTYDVARRNDLESVRDIFVMVNLCACAVTFVYCLWVKTYLFFSDEMASLQQ